MTREPDGFNKRLMSYMKPVNIFRTRSKINPVLEVNLVNGKVVLDAGRSNYSFGNLHKVFRILFNKLEIEKKEVGEALALGFGAGSVADILIRELKMDCRITGVEIDEKVIEIAKRFFSAYDLPGVSVAEADALEFIRSGTTHYDLIIVDLYIENLVPGHFHSREFIGLLKKRLKEKGMVVFNKLVFDSKTGMEAEYLFETFKAYFGQVSMIRIHKTWSNRMIVAEKQSEKETA